ncbi:MAG: hypothetical protein HY299_02500 [Verrucomicrobia bacterium]|nr:hypothetical protein [Verrucomicrobiota bacterium]
MDNVRIPGLSRLDSLDLKKRFPKAEIAFEPTTGSDAAHGELAAIALVALTVVGVQALAAWLMKNRKKNRIEKTVEIVDKKGARRTEKIVIELSESTSEADVVKQLGKMMHVDVASLFK